MIAIGFLFVFWAQAQPKNAAGILHNRRACSALQGIGGRATNKQSAKVRRLPCLPIIYWTQIHAFQRFVQIAQVNDNEKRNDFHIVNDSISFNMALKENSD